MSEISKTGGMAGTPRNTGGTRQVLQVCADPGVRTLLERVLAPLHGVAVVTAGGADEGAKALAHLAGLDLIVVEDLWDVRANTLLQRWQGDRALRRIPVLLVTNYVDYTKLRHLRGLGIRHVLIKPVSEAQLQKKLGQLLTRVDGETLTAVEAVRHLPFFESLDDHAAGALLELSYRTHHEPGEVIIQPGDPVDKIGIVLNGEATVTDPNGVPDDVPLNRLTTGRLIGETALLHRQPARFEVRALEPTELILLPFFALELIPPELKEQVFRAMLRDSTAKLLEMNQRYGELYTAFRRMQS